MQCFGGLPYCFPYCCLLSESHSVTRQVTSLSPPACHGGGGLSQLEKYVFDREPLFLPLRTCCRHSRSWACPNIFVKRNACASLVPHLFFLTKKCFVFYFCLFCCCVFVLFCFFTKKSCFLSFLFFFFFPLINERVLFGPPAHFSHWVACFLEAELCEASVCFG